MLRRFSSRFIKEYLFDLVLELLHDPVPNVRISAMPFLPQLKHCVKLPEDVELLERLNSTISSVLADSDRDVSASARAVNDTFKRTPMRMAGGVALASPTSAVGVGGGADGAVVYVSESEDKRREEEDAEVGFTAEDAKE